jgi:hypothetical protein
VWIAAEGSSRQTKLETKLNTEKQRLSPKIASKIQMAMNLKF